MRKALARAAAWLALALPALAVVPLLGGCFDADPTARPDDWCHGARDGTPCDDGNPCTEDDLCGLGVCSGRAIADGEACDDGDLCSEGDTCRAGVCVATAKDCAALDDLCRRGTCAPETGACVETPLDDGTACDDGDPCTLGDVCAAGACATTPKDCGAFDAPCQAGVCDRASGACGAAPHADGTGCDDDDPCTVDDACAAGACAGAEKDCSALDGPCQTGVCDGATGECGAAVFADGARCDDGDACTEDDTCADGVCGGPPKECPAPAPCHVATCDSETGACGEVTLEDGATCEDGDACSENDACLAGDCRAGPPKECPSPEACHVATCDPENGDCGTAYVPDGTVCDDGDVCTVGDACAAGVCVPGEVNCPCRGRPDGERCDDGDPCTVGDACAAEACVGAPKACATPDDCHAALCDAATGACGAVPLPDETACDDGNPCTAGEACAAGYCGGGVPLADGAPCDDGNACSLDDACLDGLCGGAPGDCSGLDDGICLVGACDPATGDCVAAPLPVGTACDDGDPCTVGDGCLFGACRGRRMDCSHLDDGLCVVGVCEGGACGFGDAPDETPCDDDDRCTGQDACLAGVCAGDEDLSCSSCAGPEAAPGSACDDGNPCTVDDACAEEAEGLRCAGQPRDCSERNDACNVGVCAVTTAGEGWECRPVLTRAGLPCDDADPCTLVDVCGACTAEDGCRGGRCRGAAIALCEGDEPYTACEPRAAEDETAAAAIVLPLTDGAATLLGWTEPAADRDWYALTLEEGRLLSVATAPHCASALDTVIGVYGSDGQSALATSDDVDGGGWSGVTGLRVPWDGIYFVSVRAYATSGVGTYLLSVDAAPCGDDAECGCADLFCDDGRCLPRIAREEESNDTSDAATAFALDGGVPAHASVEGTVASYGDADWFAIDLVADVPVTFETRAFCDDTRLDPELALYAADGVTRLAYAADGGLGGHAALRAFVPPAAGRYLLRVRGEAASRGAYVLSARDHRCEAAADCGCVDQTCDGAPDAPGLCVPATSAEEGAVAPLAVGARSHGRIDAPFDSDEFEVALAPGPDGAPAAYDIVTEAYCGAATDTVLAVFDGDGARVGGDDDGGDQPCERCAAVRALIVATPGTYTVRVSAYGAEVGDYVVAVRPNEEATAR